MDSIAIGWNKNASGKVQFFPNTQHFRQYSTQKIKSRETKTNRKKVLCNLVGPTIHHDVFGNTDQNGSGTIRSQRSFLKDHDYTSSSSSNIFDPELPVTNDNQICSARATIITFIIVILIIIASGIAIGVTFATIKSQQNTSGTITGNKNQNSLSTVSTTAIVSIVSIGSQNGAPCTSYTTINDPTRNVAQIGIYASCDNGPLFNTSNGGSWIRFVGTGGTIIPLTSPGTNHCGGFLSGWFNGTLPTTVGTTTNALICFSTYSGDCPISVNTSVTYCSSFYVYFLPPVLACNGRYCTT